jgi:hypothetical protein
MGGGEKGIEVVKKLVMNREWKRREVYGMSIGSPDIIPGRRLRGFLVTRKRELYRFSVVKKNFMRNMRDAMSEFLRSEEEAGTGSGLRGSTGLPGGGGSTGIVLEVQEGEAREASLAGR